MGLNRVSNWESILHNKIAESKYLVFEYGRNDCTIWAANVIKSYTDLAWEPTWNNKTSALKQHSKKPLEIQATEVLGSPRSNILMTQRGDLVQKDLGIDAKFGICIGRKVVFLKEIEGICYVDLKDCIYSWRV